MKQKTIIQVWGKADTGKSRTIRILKEEFIKKHLNPNHDYDLEKVAKSDEISRIIECKNLKVGFESMGDYLGYGNLKEHLDDFILKDKCDILICASRIYNDVAKYIRTLADENAYRIIKVTNYVGNRNEFEEKEQNELCKLSAIHFLALIDEIIKGSI